MNNYPLVEINKDLWSKKVSLCSMYTIPAEDDALPGLREMQEMLTRLITLPLQETLAEEHVQYFFVTVFPIACQKIIRSRYFKSPEVLKLSNSIIQNSVYLTEKYLNPYGVKFPKFLDILTIVFSTDQYYFKTNNQLSFSIYPYSYFNPKSTLPDLKVGDLVDILKTGKSFSDKVSWSRGQVVELDDFDVKVVYLNDCQGATTIVRRDSYQLQPFKSKSHNFEWRFNLKEGDLVDYQDSFGSWYNGTVTEVYQEEQGNKRVKIAQKVYNQSGPRSDQKGNYYGMSDYDQILDVTSHKLQPYCTVAKQFVYQSSKTSYDAVDDSNDYQFSEIDGERVYGLPRKKYLSDLLFQTINGFGRRGGFTTFLSFLEKETNFQVLGYFTKGISGICPYLHRAIVVEIVEKLRVSFQRHIFENPQKITNQFTKQKSEMVFVGLRTLQKRLYSTEKVYRYENSLKMKLVDSCLQSQSLKKKLQGLNELKDIVKSVTYVSEKNKWIKNWVKENNIFQKIYIVNSHVQLIKKSEDFFKYLISQSILQVTDLQRLYKMAQKGDYESRISLYKLFQEMSHIFKKQHVEYLIDTILESELSLILNEDIDLLHELARYSNYFPMEKVISFFESIILGQNKVKQLNDYAIKRYSQLVAKNHQLKPYRRNIIKSFLQRMSTHDVSQVTKVLRGIFQGIGYGDWGKRDLSQILAEEKVDQVSINTIKKYKQHPDFNKIATNILQFLLSVYKLSYKAKIYLSTLVEIWDILQGNEDKEKQFYRWANDLTKCDQGIESTGENQEFEVFFRKLFPPNKLKDIKGTQFELAKNFFIEVNKKLRYISVSNTIRDKDLQKEYSRKVQMNKLRLIDELIDMIYKVESESINSQVLNFFVELYNSKTNTQQQIDQFFNKLLADFRKYYEQKEYQMVGKTIKLIEVVINDSEKSVDTNIESLTSKKKFEEVKFIIINQTIYSSDIVKKVQKYFPMNMPVIRLRKILAKQFNLTWQEIKIVAAKEIPDYQNSRTLKEIKLNPNTPLTVSKRIITSQAEGQLIIGDQLNPKVVRCFKIIFQKFSTDGKMDKNQCNGFTGTCLGSTCTTKYYNQKISNLYNTYDDDNDGLLTFQNFLTFYQDAAKDRPSTVWSNLRSFGVKGDFRFNYEPEEEVEVKNYPRVSLAEEPKIYDILFDLLRIKGVAQYAFELLQRLPVSKEIQIQLLNISSEEDLDKIFQTQDYYELFYKLNVIEYLAYSNDLVEQSEKEWQSKFIELRGYEKLFTCLQKLEFCRQQIQGEIDINKQILYASLSLLNEYWVECFAYEQVLKLKQSLALIQSDFQIDEKIEYLVTGSFPEKDQSLTIHPSTIPKIQSKYEWRSIDRSQIISFFLTILKQLWDKVHEVSLKVSYDEKFYILSSIIFKLFDVLNVLLMNQNPCHIIDQISALLDKVPSAILLSKLYCFIMCQCFFASEDFKFQGVYIRQLFKNLTKETITSEHFRVLAVLVSKFGLGNTEKNQEESEQTEKMKKILFQNVSNNNNELTVEGCAKLLCNFNLQGLSFEFFKQIWEERLFNPDTICQKKQTKQTLYELILKLCEDNDSYTDRIIGTVKETIEDKAQKMKIVYCNEFKERSSSGYAGLKNLGNICYMNSMIQQLFMNKNFRYLLLRVNDNEPHTNTQVINKNDELRLVDDNFLHQIQRIFAYLEKTNRIDFAPHDFCVAYKPFGEPVNIMIQQDVQQFISMFFDRLEMGLAKTPFKKLVQDFYLGKTVNLFKCHSCNQTKKVQENFHSISLEVKNSKSLIQSFNKFNLGQLINDYTCDFCKQKVDVSKKTRISKAPKCLIIHLQRIIFNLQTFIEEKISNKHSFPHDFNLHQYTLDYYERKEANQAQVEQSADMMYSLIGIVCHTGNAAAGHYISYIKTDENKWLEFNDSIISSFNPINIESQCFGGSFSTSSAYDDQYDFDRRETSKSAYLLIYEKKGGNTIEMVMDKIYEEFKNQENKQEAKKQFLKTMSLDQVIKAVRKKSKKPEPMEEGEVDQSPSEQEGLETGDNMTNIMSESQGQSSAHQDSQTQTKKLLEEKEREIKRHNSEDQIEENQNKMVEGQQVMKKVENSLFIQEPITPYISNELMEEIREDNIIHFIERCLSSESFTKFFANLLIKSHSQHQQMLPLCQKLTFGFWLKSPCFKDLLHMLDQMIHYCPSGFETIIVENPAIITLLIQNSDAKIRTSMANFLAKAISDVLITKKVRMDDENIDKQPTIIFLDQLLSLLPTTVSKCWTKFSEYFQFWCEFSTKGEIAVEYMMSRQIIKHFMDYFLHDKSPLKISLKNRQHSIGSSYASPNFSMLLRCISSLLKNRMEIKRQIKLSTEEEIMIMSCESLEKLISDNYEAVACQLVKQLCPHNLFTSQKTAIVILKGISKSNYESIQPYLEVLHEFVMIEDEYQDLRIKWVVGKQTLALSSLSKKIVAMNSYSSDQRIYNFDSSIHLESGASLLDPIFIYYKRIQNYSFLCLRAVLKLCNESTKLRKYIFNLSSPTLSFSHYIDFFKGFIDKYFEDSKKVYAYYTSSSSGFNKQQLAKVTKQLYEKVLQRRQNDLIEQKIEESKKEAEEQDDKQIKDEESGEKVKDSSPQSGQNIKDVQNQDIEVIELKAMKKPKEKEQAQLNDNHEENSNEIQKDQNVPKDQDLTRDEGTEKDQDAVKDQNTDKDETKDEGQVRTHAGDTKIPVNSDEDEEQKNNFNDDGYNSWDEEVPELIGKSSNKAKKSSGKDDEYAIHVIDETGFLDVSSEEQEPLMKSKLKQEGQKGDKEYTETWHPVKFDFNAINEKNYLDGVQISEHQSIVTFVMTKPTGTSNRSFTSTLSSQKTIDRILPQTWEKQKTETVHGFFVRNTKRENIRIQTDDGCMSCKGNDSCWVWADQIIKVFTCEKTIDWPKWTLYPKKME